MQEDGPKWLVLLLLCLCSRGIDFRLSMLVLWVCLTALWAPDWPVHLFGVLIFAALASVRVSPMAFPVALAGVCVLALFLADGGMGNPNFLSEFVAVCIPWCFLTKRTRWLLIPAFFTLFMADSKTGWFGLWLASVVWLWGYDRWLAGIWLMLPVNLAIFEVIDISGSLQARAEIWINTVFMWLDRPFFGVGVGGFDYFYGKYDSIHLMFFPDWGYYHPITKYAGAAHNEYLQILAETGVIGLGLFVWFLSGLKWRGIPAWSVGIGLALSLIGFPLQNPATLAVMALSMAMMHEAPRIPRVIPVAISAVLMGFMVQTLRGQYAYRDVIAYHRTDPRRAIEANIRAYKLAPWDFRFRYQLYPMLTRAAATGARVPESTWTRALEISKSASPYSRYLKALENAHS